MNLLGQDNMKNILNTFYGRELKISEVSTALFTDVENVSVACVILNNFKDQKIEDIRFVSNKESETKSQVISLNTFVKNDGRFYILFVNHPKGCLSVSKENYALYKYGKSITDDFDVIQVCKDKKVYSSIKQILKVIF